jgi:hypothetical protein
MTTTFRLNTDELDATFIERVKAAFPHQQIEIMVSEPDETDRIIANPELRDRLLRAIDDIEQGRNLVTPDQSLFQ